MAMKTPSAMPGAHQLENLRRNLMSIGTDATRPRTPKSAVPPTPATSAVPTNGPISCCAVRSQTDDPAKDPAEHRPDRSTRPLDRLVGHGSGGDLARADGRFQAGEGACDSHSLRLRSYAEGPMEKQ